MHAGGGITETFLLSCCDEILSQNPADVCEASAGFFVCGWDSLAYMALVC